MLTDTFVAMHYHYLSTGILCVVLLFQLVCKICKALVIVCINSIHDNETKNKV